MTNNEVLRRLRYIFDLSDEKMTELFDISNFEAPRWMVSNWMKPDSDEEFREMKDVELAIFLNGVIADKRGLKDGKVPVPEESINNNIILRKLKIALSFKDEDIVSIIESVDLRLSKNEVNAFFRAPSQRQYRECKDQFMRYFLTGLQKKLRP